MGSKKLIYGLTVIFLIVSIVYGSGLGGAIVMFAVGSIILLFVRNKPTLIHKINWALIGGIGLTILIYLHRYLRLIK